MRLFFVVSWSFLLLAATACSSSDAPDDADGFSSQANSPPFRYGNTCTKVVSSSYGTASAETKTPLCLEQRACWDDVPAPTHTYDGTASYSRRTYYTDVVWFEGTCEDPRPVSCDTRPRPNSCADCQYDICCGSVAVCEDDPNCVAIDECIVACGTDTSCVRACSQRGDRVASENHARALDCVVEWCEDECNAP